MKLDGKTIPAPQNIKRREAYLLNNADKLPTKYVQAQLLKIAIERSHKKLRWETPINYFHREERKQETAKMFSPVKKQGFIDRVKSIFRSQRGQ